ncbi:MAG: hypothetical protein V7L07_13695 [Nostoc sp.]
MHCKSPLLKVVVVALYGIFQAIAKVSNHPRICWARAIAQGLHLLTFLGQVSVFHAIDNCYNF